MKCTHGDILRVQSEAVVNTVNCVGLMGKGIALQFRNAYPNNFRAYQKACKVGDVQPGRMFVFETGLLIGPRFIINFPTKRHWSEKSRMNDIEEGLKSLRSEIEELGVRSIAIPPLGCGFGGLNWPEVKKLIVTHLGGMVGVEILIYEPSGAQDAKGMGHQKKGRSSRGKE